jgi:hypothetical protein
LFPERLFYLGSEKDADDVGQYGEGFKVAATCLLRDHSVAIIAASGNDLLRLRIAEKSVRETKLYPIEYDFFDSDRKIEGASKRRFRLACQDDRAGGSGVAAPNPGRDHAEAAT